MKNEQKKLILCNFSTFFKKLPANLLQMSTVRRCRTVISEVVRYEKAWSSINKAFYDLFIADCRMPLIWVNVNQAKRAHLSIQQAEHPKGNSVAGTRLDVIDGKVAVGLVLDLVEGLAGAAYLKEILAIDEEIALLRHGDIGHRL